MPPTGYEVGLSRPTGPRAEVLLKWSGLLLVFLAAVFLVSTAIDRGWIGPELQLAGSFAIGGALVAAGLALEHRRAGWADPLTGVGVTVLAVCAVAGWQWLELAVPEVWLAVAVAVHAGALWLTQRFDGPGLAATGLAVTVPAVLWIAELAPVSAVLTAGLAISTMAAALMVRRPSLHLVSVAISLTAFFALAVAGDGTIAITLAAGIATAIAIWMMPVAFDQRSTRASTGERDEWAPSLWVDASRRVLISLPALVGFAAAVAARADSHDSGLIMAASGSIALLSGGALWWMAGQSTAGQSTAGQSRLTISPVIWVSQLLGGATAVLIASALLLDGPALLASLIMQSAALLVFNRLVDDPFAKVQAGIVTGIAGLFGLGRMVAGIDRALPWIDHLTHLALVAVIAGWSRVDPDAKAAEGRRTVLGLTAYLGAMLWAIPTFIHLAQGQAAISATWALLGLATLVIGSLNGSNRAVQAGLATLGIVVAKALTVDLVDVDTFWRVGLFFVLGGTFLAVSYRFGSGLGTLGGSSAMPSTNPNDDPDADAMRQAVPTAAPQPPQRPQTVGARQFDQASVDQASVDAASVDRA